MQTPTVRGRMDIVEEELLNMNSRMDALTQQFEKFFKMMEKTPKIAEERTPAVNDEKVMQLNTEMKPFIPKYTNEEEEFQFKPSDETTLVKINEKDKEMIKADFIKSYKLIKENNVNNNSNTKRALDQPQFETDDEENAEEDHTDNNLSDEESGNEFVQRGEVLPTANHN